MIVSVLALCDRITPLRLTKTLMNLSDGLFNVGDGMIYEPVKDSQHQQSIFV